VPEHHVGELVVAVQDAGPEGLRRVPAQPLGGHVEAGDLAEPEAGEVVEPAVDLPLQEPLGLPEALEPAGLPVHARELRDAVDQLEGEPGARLEVAVEGRRPSPRVHR
jgi:hypothetical protein